MECNGTNGSVKYTQECQASTTPLVKTEHFVEYMPCDSQLNNVIMLVIS